MIRDAARWTRGQRKNPRQERASEAERENPHRGGPDCEGKRAPASPRIVRARRGCCSPSIARLMITSRRPWDPAENCRRHGGARHLRSTRGTFGHDAEPGLGDTRGGVAAPSRGHARWRIERVPVPPAYQECAPRPVRPLSTLSISAGAAARQNRRPPCSSTLVRVSLSESQSKWRADTRPSANEPIC